MKKRNFAIAASAVFLISAAFVSSMADQAIMAEASEGTVTDMTTSSAYHDLCLLYHDGDFEDYYPFLDDSIVREDSRFSQYQMICSRPYGEDLYTYWYFHDLPSDSPDRVYDIGYDSKASYQIRCYFEVAASKNNVKYQSDSVSLVNAEKVGEPYNIGSEWLVKLKIPGAFPGISVGDSGSAQILGLKASSWDVEIPEDKHQIFKYEDAQYDITAKLWGDVSKTVAVTKAEARPALFPKWDMDTSEFFYMTPTIKDYGYSEVHTLFFDLDRDPSEIIHMDLNYVMIEFYSEGLYTTEERVGETWRTAVHQVPEGTKYVPGNSIEAEYEGTEYGTKKTVIHKDVYKDDSFSVEQVHKNAFGGWFGTLPETTYEKQFQSRIIAMNPNGANMIDFVEQDQEFKEWLMTYGAKEEGDLYEYAVFFDVTDSSWTNKLTRNDWWNNKQYALYSAHTAQGIVSTRMTVKNELEVEEWNVFMQPVNEKEGRGVAPHKFTLNEIWISMSKKNPWVKNLILTVYVVLVSLITITATYISIKYTF